MLTRVSFKTLNLATGISRFFFIIWVKNNLIKELIKKSLKEAVQK
jgi:hypothetical protein